MTEKTLGNNKPVILFKYGGNAMVDDILKREVLKNICMVRNKGNNVIIVHGGGPFIGEALKEAAIESEFIEGHRKTSPEAFEYVEMALKGKVNGKLVGMINSLGYKAVGLSGKDGQIVMASKRMHTTVVDGANKEIDLGQVGNVAHVDPTLITLLLENEYIPVITCLAADKSGNGFNINADMFAGHLAGAMEAKLYIILTDVDGLLYDKDDPDSLIREIDLTEANRLQEKNIIAGGMIPKVESCEIAINKGAGSARIINGTDPAKILEAAGDQMVGTLIRK